ncbi:MAG: hypothetical protein PHS17_17045 [Desulfobacterales bacterium]|nr:hypothetical protein [Desulfobacterales bacterium]
MEKAANGCCNRMGELAGCDMTGKGKGDKLGKRASNLFTAGFALKSRGRFELPTMSNHFLAGRHDSPSPLLHARHALAFETAYSYSRPQTASLWSRPSGRALWLKPSSKDKKL